MPGSEEFPLVRLSSEQALLNRQKSKREWTQRNPDATKKAIREWQKAHQEELVIAHKAWRKANPQILKTSRKKSYNKRMLDYKTRIAHLASTAKVRAKEKQVPFDISNEYLIKLYEEQDGRCLLTKRPFDLTRSNESRVNSNAPSLDRIIPNLGYIKDNVRFIIHHMNIALNEYGQDAFESLIKDYCGKHIRS